MRKRLTSIVLGAALAIGLGLPGIASAQATAAPAKATKAAKAVTPAASQADIDAATARGDVWVNTGSGKYHPAGDKYYGKTKAGKFMSKADADKAGYTAVKASAVGKKAAKAATDTTKK